MNPLIASSLPGRLRLRHRALRDPEQLAKLRAALALWPGVLALEPNARAGSLLIHYDPLRPEPQPFDERAVTAAQDLLGIRSAGAGVGHRHVDRPAGLPRVKVNRWAKQGMLASLAVSLALAAAGSKTWHAIAGIAFLHGLAVHLWIHRQRLIR